MSDDVSSPRDDPSSSPGPPGQPLLEPETGKGGAQGAIGGDGAETEPARETDIWVGRTHWKHYAGRLGLWLLANVVLAVLIGWAASRADWLGWGGAFWLIAGVFLVSGLVVVGRVLLTILGTRYRLTSQRLFIERGIFGQTVDQSELIRVDDVRLQKSFLDRVFGLGSVEILSTDASDREITIEGIADPEAVAEGIRTRMRIMRKKSLFVENL
jgi:membrane protein YdbS with pleckstrin-like domain